MTKITYGQLDISPVVKGINRKNPFSLSLSIEIGLSFSLNFTFQGNEVLLYIMPKSNLWILDKGWAYLCEICVFGERFILPQVTHVLLICRPEYFVRTF